MRLITTSFSHLSKEKSLRSDCVFQRVIAGNEEYNEDYYRFVELFSTNEIRVSTNELAEDFLYCQIGDVDKGGTPHPASLNFDTRSLLDEDYYKKIEKGDIMAVNENDILMSFLLPQDNSILGKFIRIDAESQDIYFSRAFLRIIPRSHPALLYYYLRTVYYNRLVATARVRKGYTGYATLSSDDLLTLRFKKNEIDRLFANASVITPKILQIEERIKDKEKEINGIEAIINEVFQREFNFDYDRFEELKKQRHFISSHFDFSNNPDLRFSSKFHRPAGDFVMEQLTAVSDKKIKHYISEPIVLGASVSPKDYDENGDYYYISMATIKKWFFDAETAATVSNAYSSAKNEKTVRANDILLARSGEGTIGKVAIITEDINGVFADFTMRIRFDETRYNPMFAYYYMRSEYFQYLVEVYKKGLGNNTNIFPIVIQEFPIPDISLAEQNRIVDEIQAEMNNQNSIQTEISSLRSQIGDIITETIFD